MFLDDELLEMCKNSDTSMEGIHKLNADICDKCQDYYVVRMYPGMSKVEAKRVLDRTFNLFDSFVRAAKKSNNYKLRFLGDFFEQHSFKKQFMGVTDLREMYESL
jgi:hypothetical protein